MRILCSIVTPSTTLMSSCHSKITGSGSIRPRIVCDQLVWDKAILLQHLAHEFQRGTLVPLALSASEAVAHWKIRRSPTGPTDSTKSLRAQMDTKQIQMMAPEIYRWWWSDRSRGDKLFWKTTIYGVAMRRGIEGEFSAPTLIVWIGFVCRSLKIAAERAPFIPAPVSTLQRLSRTSGIVCCGSR